MIKLLRENESEYQKVKKGTSMILCFYRQEVETFKEKHKIIDVHFFPFFPMK